MGNQRNAFNDVTTAVEEVDQADVDTDANGEFTVQMQDLRKIESRAQVHAQSRGSGFVCNCTGISGNNVTIAVFQSNSNVGSLNAISATDVTAVDIYAEGQ